MSTGSGTPGSTPTGVGRSSGGFDRAAINVRVVYIDFYLTSLSSLSSSTAFHAALLTTAGISPHLRRPVIRIFGATPAGQHVAVHLHGPLPYFYLPLPPSVSQESTPAFISTLRQGLEAAMRNTYHPDASADGQGENENLVATDVKYICDIVPVVRTSIYGYQGPQVFLKVVAWAPSYVSKLASIAASGRLANDIGPLQPFESHIPFPLQVMTDLGLVGMGYANLASFKFRGSLPDIGTTEGERPWLKDNLTRRFGKGLEEDLPDLVWGFDIPKKTQCDLELDVFSSDVLNSKDIEVSVSKAASPLCQKETSLSRLKFVARSLKVLWEEEWIRTGEMPKLEQERPREVKAGASYTEPKMRKLLEELVDGSRDRIEIPESKPLDEFHEVADWLGKGTLELESEDEETEEMLQKEWEDIADCTQALSAQDKLPKESSTVPQMDGPDGQEEGGHKRKKRKKSKRRKKLRFGEYEPLVVANGTQQSCRTVESQQRQTQRVTFADSPSQQPKSSYAPIISLTGAARSEAQEIVDGEDKNASEPKLIHQYEADMDAGSQEQPEVSLRSNARDPELTQNGAKAEAPLDALNKGDVSNEPPKLKKLESAIPRSRDSLKAAPATESPSCKHLMARVHGNSKSLEVPTDASSSGTDKDIRPPSGKCRSPRKDTSGAIRASLEEPQRPPQLPRSQSSNDSGKTSVRSSSFPAPSLGSLALAMRPTRAPPSILALKESFREKGILPIDYPAPFYSNKEDAPGRPVTYAGVSFKIPSKSDLIQPYNSEISNLPQDNEPYLTSVVIPVRSPPRFCDLRSTLNSRGRKSAGGKTTLIDSAGRTVKVAAGFGAERDSEQTQFVDFGSHKMSKVRRRIDTGIDDRSSDDSEDEHSTGSIVNGLSGNLTEGTVNRNGITGKRDGERERLNRPASPKYDERSFYMALPSLRNRTLTQKGKFRHLIDNKNTDNSTSIVAQSKGPKSAKQIGVASPLHEHQNLTLIVVEILAKTRGNLLPDPRFDSLCAVTLVIRDERVRKGEQRDHALTFVHLGIESDTIKERKRSDLGTNVHLMPSEHALLDAVAATVVNVDADILAGYETQNGSVGYLLDRAAILGHPFARNISRMPDFDRRLMSNAGVLNNHQGVGSAAAQYFHRKGVNIGVTGRHVINVWRVVRSEVKLAGYSLESVALEVLNTRVPSHSHADLVRWFLSGRRTFRALQSVMIRARSVLSIIDALDIVGRTGELARVFGVDFMSVLTRGSQFRVESMMIRVAHAKGFLLLAAQREQVFRQPAVECLPLVMEPMSAYYTDPVIVLDFQSLYPSMIIAHNLCFTTMLGNIRRSRFWNSPRMLGVVKDYTPPSIEDLGGPESVYIAPNGEAFVTTQVRQGVLPVMLKEVLDTRIMVKKAMKSVGSATEASGLLRLLNARQFGLKMIANVSYGYTAASFSGRMPCAGLADAIVQSGRSALENIVAEVHDVLGEQFGAEVVYGDTDSLFVRVSGASRKEAFAVGRKICCMVERLFPVPIKLKLEKVFHPCVLVTKKRYVGYAYDSEDSCVPIFDAKGIETVRRDSCAIVQKTMEKSLRILFETCDVSRVKRAVQRTMRRVLTGRVPLSEFIFRKEVRLGTYKEGHLPPAAIVATKAMEADPRAAPRYGERVSFVVVYDRPGASLKDSVCTPDAFLEAERSGMARLNATYYIKKQILPPLDRIFSLMGVKVASWYVELPRPYFRVLSRATRKSINMKKGASSTGQSSMYRYYASERCSLCHKRGGRHRICHECTSDEAKMQHVYFILASRQRALEARSRWLDKLCLTCVAGDEQDSTEIKCSNLECSVTYLRHTCTERMISGRFDLDESSNRAEMHEVF